jgi:hypothetical protein
MVITVPEARTLPLAAHEARVAEATNTPFTSPFPATTTGAPAATTATTSTSSSTTTTTTHGQPAAPQPFQHNVHPASPFATAMHDLGVTTTTERIFNEVQNVPAYVEGCVGEASVSTVFYYALVVEVSNGFRCVWFC